MLNMWDIIYKQANKQIHTRSINNKAQQSSKPHTVEVFALSAA